MGDGQVCAFLRGEVVLAMCVEREGNRAVKGFCLFNNGIGMAVIVSPEDADRAEALFKEQGETVYRIGGIVRRPEGAPGCIVI